MHEKSQDALTVKLENIRQLISLRQLAEAAAQCAEVAHALPKNLQVLSLAAEIALLLGKIVEAEQLLGRAVTLSPMDAELLIRHGQILLQLGRKSEALTVASRVDKIPPDDSALRDALGTLLTHLEEPQRALRHFEHAVHQAPRNWGFRYNLAMAQRMVGHFDAAELNLDQVIRMRPDDGEAFHARSDLRSQTRERNHVRELELTLSRLTGKRASLPVAFALAKELEDLGEYSRSFEYLHTACQAYRACLRYDVAEDIAVLEKLRSTHTLEIFETIRAGFDNEECIFVVGLPRSGTTLVERILGAHGGVYAAGELDAFPTVSIEATARQGGGPVRKLDFVDRSLTLDFASLGRAYLDATRPRTGHTTKFTDKLPLNYLYAGLIHAALPKARFVALYRHPMDVCYAMYRTLFAAAYPFTYDLYDLARYYVAWERLMGHWATVIGDAWLTVRYEDLIADQEAVTRTVLEHCQLAWDPSCIDFKNRLGAVSTASAVQVRRPLHANSVGKWRHYSRQLEPIATYLERNGILVA
jgi:tetratricopeptide (TPR) repeat protein